MTLCLALGIKKATSTVIAHPALVLTPVFSFWTFGPRKSGGCCAYKRAEPGICVSFRLTWFNTILTLFGMFGVVAIHDTFIIGTNPLPLSLLRWMFQILFLMFAPAAICLLLIQFLDKCACCCCRCFKENCLPMTEKIVYDTENPLSY